MPLYIFMVFDTIVFAMLQTIERHITPRLKKLAAQFPVVTVLGPRQSGKTTLVRETFPKHTYLNLEDALTREVATLDYRDFFKRHPGPVILDEIQRVPELLSAVQVLSDEKRETGRFILTGSHQPQLHARVSQSLAGRTAILRLLPLSIAELSGAGIELDRDEYLVRGFMPAHYAHDIAPADLYSAYYSTYVERDVRQLVNIDKQNAFALFVKLLAGRVGQIVSLRSMAGETGVSVPTLSAWLSVLEASYIVFRLNPYFNNFGKRYTKTAKLYFTEPGLATWLLGITTPEQVVRDPLFGGLFENMVVVEALKARYNAGEQPELYYYRDSNAVEVDLILNKARRLMPIEIKAARTPSTSFAKQLKTFQKHAGNVVFSPTVLHGGDMEMTAEGVNYTNFKNMERVINEATPPLPPPSSPKKS